MHQIVYHGSFILLSEASSLPRLQDATNEEIALDLPFVRLIPHENKNHKINLPRGEFVLVAVCYLG